MSLSNKKTHVSEFPVRTTGQRATCPGETSTSGGNASEQCGNRNSHRGSKAQPGGSADRTEQLPSIVRSGLARSERNVGTEFNRPRV